MVNCLFCAKLISNKRKYCSKKCDGQHRTLISIENWKKGLISGHKGKIQNIKPFVRNYLLSKNNYSCSKCKWNTPHPISQIPPLEVNHIDGDASNSVESNLELLCPNCHSLTINFKNRNKGRGRQNR